MRKNKTMRTASVLLVATLLTTSVLFGTFAKYTTQDSASDTARVAKWGVTVLASGSLFGQNYNGNTDTVTTNEKVDEISATVMNNVDNTSNDGKNIVAPGTQNTTGIKLAVKGTPEVENRITVTTDTKNDKNEEIWLAAGEYGVMVVATESVTTDNYANYYTYDRTDEKYVKAASYNEAGPYYELHDVVAVTENEANAGKYYPIEWTVTKNGTTGTLTTTSYRTVEKMYSALSGEFASTNNANAKLDDVYTITWKWAIEQQNGADTILGNLQSNDNSTSYKVVKKSNNDYVDIEETDYNLNVGFNATITVAQVD